MSNLKSSICAGLAALFLTLVPAAAEAKSSSKSSTSSASKSKSSPSKSSTAKSHGKSSAGKPKFSSEQDKHKARVRATKPGRHK